MRGQAYLTRAEVEEFADVSRSTVERAVWEYRRTGGRSGLRPVQRTTRGRRKFHISDVRAWSGEDDRKVVQLRNTA